MKLTGFYHLGRNSMIPVSRSTAPSPAPGNARSGSGAGSNPSSLSSDSTRADLEEYANKVRNASTRLGDASSKAFDLLSKASSNGGFPGSKVKMENGNGATAAVPSPYFAKLMELRELCRSV
jgi:hypothetical protein